MHTFLIGTHKHALVTLLKPLKIPKVILFSPAKNKYD